MEAATAHAPRARIWSLQPDALLCRIGARGNEQAFDELHRRYHRQISAFVFHLLGGRHRREDAEEVVQDTFTRAFTRVREREFEGSFRAWLYVIARNRAIDLMRAERRLAEPLDDVVIELVPRAAATSEPDAAAETREDLAWLVRAIGDLPERQRSALLLRELGGLSHEAIAENLQTTTGSVRQLIGRGRDTVRRAADSDADSPSTLRRGLLDAAPWIPAATIGGGVVAGSGAGAGLGGFFAIGKLAAALATVAAVAGTAASISGPVSGAAENHRAGGLPAAPATSKLNASSGEQSTPGSRAKDRDPRGVRTERTGAVTAPRRDHHEAAGGEAPAEEAARPERDVPAEQAEPKAPRAPVAELPGTLVEDVGGVLDGSQSVPDAVGDITGSVLDTVGQTTQGLLDPPTSR